EVHHLAGGQIPAVALDADAPLGRAGQHGPDLDLLDAGGLDFPGQILCDLLVDSDDDLAGERVLHIFERDAAHDAVAQGFDNLAPGFRHQASHPGQLPDLLLAAASPGIGHDVDRIELNTLLILLRQPPEHLVRNPFGHIGPDVDDLVVALAVGNRPVLILLL